MALLYLGVLHHGRGEIDEALRLIRRAIAIDPSEAAAHNHLGLALLAQDAPEAVRSFQTAARLRPDYLDARNNLGNAFLALKRYDEAERAFHEVLRADTGHVLAHFNLGLLHYVRREFSRAEAEFSRTLELDPDFYKAHYQLGMTAENLGRFDVAAACFQSALRAEPNHHAALAALLALRNYEPDEATLARAECIVEREDIPAPERYTVPFALAKHFDKRRDFDRAARHLETANARRRPFTKYERASVDAWFAAHREAFTAESVDRLSRYGSPSERPIFIVGMPRTGTTLTEQILAAHSSVFGAGELPDVPRLVNRLPAVMTKALERTVSAYPQCVSELNADFIQTMVDYYLHVLDRHDARAARIVDKNPFNFLNVGLLAILFPRARIIHCRRHPLDVGISCAMELFELKQDFTTDFADFAHYFARYVELMRHWKRNVRVPVLEVDYEVLVTEPERVTREIVAFCGLPWEDACLAFEQTDRAVLTPSKWQVRQPVYRSSIARWRNYEKYLEPLRSALAAEGVRTD